MNGDSNGGYSLTAITGDLMMIGFIKTNHQDPNHVVLGTYRALGASAYPLHHQHG